MRARRRRECRCRHCTLTAHWADGARRAVSGQMCRVAGAEVKVLYELEADARAGLQPPSQGGQELYEISRYNVSFRDTSAYLFWLTPWRALRMSP